MADSLNATQGSLLGFLHEGPKTGWDLLEEVRSGLSRFWNVTPSHVYRELRTLEERKLVRAGEPGVRDRRPFSITPAGRRAFGAWINLEPGPEQIRFPLLVTLWFGRHLDAATLSSFLDSSRRDHEERLRLYESITSDDVHIKAVLAFGTAYERATLGWLTHLVDEFGATEGIRRAQNTNKRTDCEGDDRSAG
jgi:DNA-binding PadR family transcriptional regulator